MCSTDSVWSIDIAYLLKRYNIKATFFTVTKGVRPEYRKQEFYRKQLPEDTKRVNHLFSAAERDGVHVVQRPVALSEIRHAVLEENKLVLVLMDKRLLKCSMCDINPAPSKGIFSSRNAPGFLGHYVLIYAYHPASDNFLVKDPAAWRDTCVVSADTMEEARQAFGTDQDILFIGDAEPKEDSAKTALRSNGT